MTQSDGRPFQHTQWTHKMQNFAAVRLMSVCTICRRRNLMHTAAIHGIGHFPQRVTDTVDPLDRQKQWLSIHGRPQTGAPRIFWLQIIERRHNNCHRVVNAYFSITVICSVSSWGLISHRQNIDRDAVSFCATERN